MPASYQSLGQISSPTVSGTHGKWKGTGHIAVMQPLNTPIAGSHAHRCLFSFSPQWLHVRLVSGCVATLLELPFGHVRMRRAGRGQVVAEGVDAVMLCSQTVPKPSTQKTCLCHGKILENFQIASMGRGHVRDLCETKTRKMQRLECTACARRINTSPWGHARRWRGNCVPSGSLPQCHNKKWSSTK